MGKPTDAVPYCTKFTMHVEYADGVGYDFEYVYDPDDPGCTRAKLEVELLYKSEEMVLIPPFSNKPTITTKLNGDWDIRLRDALPVNVTMLKKDDNV